MKGSAHALDSSPLILRNADLLRSRRQWCIPLRILRQQLKKLIRILPYQRRKLRIAGANLLQDRLQHLRLRLHNLAQLLELRVVAQEIEIVAQTAFLGTGRGVEAPGSFGHGAPGALRVTSCVTRSAAICLSGGFKEINGRVAFG